MFLTRLGYGIIYFLDLIYEILKATFDVAFNGIMRQNIDPVVVEIEIVLERPVSQTILANSISLTPGTLSVDLDSENNIIKVAAISPRSKEDIIPFEPYIKKMLE
ncbi:monovalent cation/H+ antiporter subunit E [Methanobrevibacter smithii]|uniref:monovalent cation/H+ antiporter subunit E n=1 Tax=Methanobrevibacter smithii TaxID=2173 RepID=UPI0037DCA80C